MKTCYIEKDLELFCDKGESFGHQYRPIEFETFVFSGGEVHIKLKENPAICSTQVRINCRIQNSNDFMRLALAVDALRGCGIKHIEAFIPYIPYARQDRRMVTGEPLSIKVFAGIINSLKLDKVICYDVHSDVTLALIDNVEHIKNTELVRTILRDKNDYLIISPDSGAYKKIFELCRNIDYSNEIILCNKVRDVSSGKIKNISIDEADLLGKDCYIVDDICSMGNTFIGIADKLKKMNCGKVYLIVSHYEGCANEEKLKEGLSGIYKSNSISNMESDFVKNIQIRY